MTENDDDNLALDVRECDLLRLVASNHGVFRREGTSDEEVDVFAELVTGLRVLEHLGMVYIPPDDGLVVDHMHPGAGYLAAHVQLTEDGLRALDELT